MARVPLIPGVTDTTANLAAIAERLAPRPPYFGSNCCPTIEPPAASTQPVAGRSSRASMRPEHRMPTWSRSSTWGSRYESHEREAHQLRARTREGHFRLPAGHVSHLVEECDPRSLSWPARLARLTKRMCEAEQVVVEPDERIVFTRTLPEVPQVYEPADWLTMTEGRTLHEGGNVNNVAPTGACRREPACWGDAGWP